MQGVIFPALAKQKLVKLCRTKLRRPKKRSACSCRARWLSNKRRSQGIIAPEANLSFMREKLVGNDNVAALPRDIPKRLAAKRPRLDLDCRSRSIDIVTSDTADANKLEEIESFLLKCENDFLFPPRPPAELHHALREKAELFAPTIGLHNFRASEQWLNLFISHNKQFQCSGSNVSDLKPACSNTVQPRSNDIRRKKVTPVKSSSELNELRRTTGENLPIENNNVTPTSLLNLFSSSSIVIDEDSEDELRRTTTKNLTVESNSVSSISLLNLFSSSSLVFDEDSESDCCSVSSTTIHSGGDDLVVKSSSSRKEFSSLSPSSTSAPCPDHKYLNELRSTAEDLPLDSNNASSTSLPSSNQVADENSRNLNAVHKIDDLNKKNAMTDRNNQKGNWRKRISNICNSTFPRVVLQDIFARTGSQAANENVATGKRNGRKNAKSSDENPAGSSGLPGENRRVRKRTKAKHKDDTKRTQKTNKAKTASAQTAEASCWKSTQISTSSSHHQHSGVTFDADIRGPSLACHLECGGTNGGGVTSRTQVTDLSPSLACDELFHIAENHLHSTVGGDEEDQDCESVYLRLISDGGGQQQHGSNQHTPVLADSWSERKFMLNLVEKLHLEIKSYIKANDAPS